MTRFICTFKMARESKNKTSVLQSEVSHRCSSRCLGPLTFHNQAVGEKVRLSHGGRLAEKTENTFKNGLVFSNRPVKIQEKIHLRVQRDSTNWEGALRVGFTTVPPSRYML
ncbi:E3 ubiquitin-protein ligase NEURL3-like [Pundamilia nyererei]|uniref:E3 ubiquitin-protein ligase NEURL3-like n=1 Tax=Pundamilia nyererei TaxID=303518 RepID=A0A9Y6JC46_9CICH|nr:PREDICTED: E3 ubiquitin-protein ligase NEURL3-like [Pundamilia nyererei]